MTKLLPLCLLLSACASGVLSVDPNPLEFGEVDFNQDLPSEGYNAQPIYLQNDGDKELELTITGVDDKRVLLTGQFESESPFTLRAIGPGEYHNLTLGVIGYDVEGGERDTLVEGSFTIDAPTLKDPKKLTWSFTPIRVFDNGEDD